MLSVYTITLAFLVGIIWGIYMELKILCVSLFFLSILTLTVFAKFNKQILLLLCLCLIGAMYVSYQIYTFDSKYIDKTNLTLNVTILTHKEETEFYYKYTCKTTDKDKFVILFKKNDINIFSVGERLNIDGEFMLPDVARNKGGFNYRRFLNSEGIYGMIKVENCIRLKDKNNNLIYIFQNLIHDNLRKIFSSEHAGVLSGMIVGETSSIPENIKEYFQKAGVTHLLAVSGSNVAMVIVFSNFIFSKIFGKQYSDYFSVLFVVFFVMLAGASPSVIRAGIMAILNLVANILIRNSESITNVFLSAFIILIFNPLSILNVGFILSFVGTIGIITLSDVIMVILKKFFNNKIILETASVTIAAQIALFPIMLYFFNSLSIISIFSNLLIVPITGIITILGIIIFLVSIFFMPLARLVSILIIPMMDYVLNITKLCSKFEFLNLILPTPKIWMIIIFYSILYIKVYKIKHREDNYLERISSENINYNVEKVEKCVYMLTSFLIVFLILNTLTTKTYVELTAIDVGQGDAFLVVTENKKTILIDGGGSETSNFDVGDNILVPYLLDKGIFKIDYIFISHAHADHIDGIYSVLKDLKVGEIFIGAQLENDKKVEKLYSLAKKNNIKIRKVEAGNFLQIDNIKINILHPKKDYLDENINNLSLIMNFECNNRKILFTGDAEINVEDKLMGDIKADILKVGHHGSKTSSSETFITKVSPKVSLISVAENNMYEHPNEKVLKRLQDISKVFMTKEAGEINIKIYKNGEMHIFTFLENTTFILK